MFAQRGWRRVGIALGIAGVGLAALWLAMSRRVEAGIQTLSQTTLADFSQGEFVRTGLADVGDGAVSLLRAGLSGEWITTVVTAGLTPRWGHSAVYTNGRIYVIGGVNDSSAPNAITVTIIQSAAVQGDHNLSPWTALPTNLAAIFTSGTAYGGAVLVGDFLYVIGGRGQPLPDTGAAQAQVAYARVGADGSLTPFTPTTPLPVGLDSMAVVAWDGWIYVLGGVDANLQVTHTIFVAHPDPTTGAIPAWIPLTWTLPYPLYGHAAVADQGFLYVIGGVTQTNGSPLFEVWFAPLGSGTLQAPFTRTAPLDNNLVELAAVGYNGLLLTSGGLQSNLSDVSQDVRAGATADNGSVITWTATSLITPPRSAHAMVVLPDGWVYVIGGRSRSNNQDLPLTHINAGRLGADGMGRFVSNGRYLAPPFHLDRRRLLRELRLHMWYPDGTEAAVRFRTQPQDTLPWNDWGAWLPITPTGEITVSIPLSAYVQALQYELALTTTNPLTAPFLLNADLLYEIPDKPPLFEKSAVPPGGTTVMSGNRITYTVVLTNDSGATLHGVWLQDLFPGGTTYVEGSAAASPGLSWTVSISGWVGEIAVLDQGKTVTFTFAVTVGAGTSEVQNQAALQTDELGLQQSNVVTHPVGALTGTLGARPPDGSLVFPGTLLTYTIRITNMTAAPVNGVVITGRLPIPVAPVSVVTSTGQAVLSAWPDLQWAISTLGSAAAAALTVTARITDAPFIADETWLTATAAFSAPLPLPIGTTAHMVRQPYALQVSKTDGRALADIDETLRYTIAVTNTGWVTVTDLRITDTLGGWPWIFFPDRPGEGQRVIPLPALGPGATALITLSAQISRSANLSDVVGFTNTVTVRSFGTSGVPTADAFEGLDTTALAGPDLIAGILLDSVIYDGRTVTFTVQVTNTDHGTARPLAGTLHCAAHWIPIGFQINGQPASADYFSLPYLPDYSDYRLRPGAFVTQTFALALAAPASLQATIDPWIPGWSIEGHGCVMETNENNNTTPPIWIEAPGEPPRYRLFLPLVLRSP